MVGHTKFGPDSGFGRMHLKFKGMDMFTGEEMKKAMMDNRNIPNEPNASIFRKWRDTFNNYFGAMDGIKSTDVIEIRLSRDDDGLVNISWAERREIGENLHFVKQKQLLVGARAKDCDVSELLERVKEGTRFDEHLSNFPLDDHGLIKESRKKYLLNLLEGELRRLQVSDEVFKWWADLPCQSTENEDIVRDGQDTMAMVDEQSASRSSPPPLPDKVNLAGTSSIPNSSLSTVSFQFLVEDTLPTVAQETELPHPISAEVNNDKDETTTSLSRVFRNPNELAQQLSGQKRKRKPSSKVQQ